MHRVSNSPRPLQEHTTEKCASRLIRKCLCFISALIGRFALFGIPSVSVLSSNSGSVGVMWFLCHDSKPSATGTSGRALLSCPPNTFWSQLTQNLLSSKCDCIASVEALRLHVFCITWASLGHVSYSRKHRAVQNQFSFSRPSRVLLHLEGDQK